MGLFDLLAEQQLSARELQAEAVEDCLLSPPTLEVRTARGQTEPAVRQPYVMTAEDADFICRAIEADQGLPPGSLVLYDPETWQQMGSMRGASN